MKNLKIGEEIWYICAHKYGIVYQKTKIKKINSCEDKICYTCNGYIFFDDDKSVYLSESDVLLACASIFIEKAFTLKGNKNVNKEI